MSASKPRRRVYIPTFTGEIEGWTMNYLSKQLWRVARTKDREDCMQEAYCVFMRVTAKYPDPVNARHFMSLYQTAWTRTFNDFSTQDTLVREAELLSDGRTMLNEPMGDTCNEGELLVMLREAPREVRMVLELMLRAPQEILDIALAGFFPTDRRAANGISAKSSARINALLGLPADMNTLERVRDYFQP